MKILHVCGAFYPCFESGGVVRSVYEISKELVKKGHEVTVYTTDGCSKRLNVKNNCPVDVEGIKTYYFRNISNTLRWKYKLYTPYYLPFIARKEIKNFDVIHLHEHRTFLAAVVAHYADKYKIPYILQPRGSLPRFTKSFQKKSFDFLFGYKIIKNSCKIIASSKIESEQYDKVFSSDKEIVYVPNGINLDEFKKLPKKGEFRKKYKIKENEKIILYLGRIHEIKGLDLLVKVFAELSKKSDNPKLVIAGPEDGYLNSLKNIAKILKIENKILFTGPLFGKDKLTAYVDADIFVLPSKYESFGNVALESLACGTPIIITKGCGLSEYIDKKVGYIIDYNKQQLLETLYNILTKDKKINIMSKNAKKFVEKFSWTKVIENLVNIYQNVIRANKIY